MLLTIWKQFTKINKIILKKENMSFIETCAKYLDMN